MKIRVTTAVQAPMLSNIRPSPPSLNPSLLLEPWRPTVRRPDYLPDTAHPLVDFGDVQSLSARLKYLMTAFRGASPQLMYGIADLAAYDDGTIRAVLVSLPLPAEKARTFLGLPDDLSLFEVVKHAGICLGQRCQGCGTAVAKRHRVFCLNTQLCTPCISERLIAFRGAMTMFKNTVPESVIAEHLLSNYAIHGSDMATLEFVSPLAKTSLALDVIYLPDLQFTMEKYSDLLGSDQVSAQDMEVEVRKRLGDRIHSSVECSAIYTNRAKTLWRRALSLGDAEITLPPHVSGMEWYIYQKRDLTAAEWKSIKKHVTKLIKDHLSHDPALEDQVTGRPGFYSCLDIDIQVLHDHLAMHKPRSVSNQVAQGASLSALFSEIFQGTDDLQEVMPSDAPTLPPGFGSEHILRRSGDVTLAALWTEVPEEHLISGHQAPLESPLIDHGTPNAVREPARPPQVELESMLGGRFPNNFSLHPAAAGLDLFPLPDKATRASAESSTTPIDLDNWLALSPVFP